MATRFTLDATSASEIQSILRRENVKDNAAFLRQDRGRSREGSMKKLEQKISGAAVVQQLSVN